MLNRRTTMGIGAVVVGVAAVAWIGWGRGASAPRPSVAPEAAAVDEGEMSPKEFEQRRRQLLESNRARAGANGGR